MKKLFTIFAIISLLLATKHVYSAVNTWDGSSSNLWIVAANWSLGHVPSSIEDVVIPSLPVNQPLLDGASGVCTNLTVNSGATLTISATSTLNATLTVSGTATIGGALSIGGTISKIGKLIAANVVWNSTSGLTSGYNSRMEISGNWTFSTGSSIDMNWCWVTFTGTGNSTITNNSAGSNFSSLTLGKTATATTFIGVSTSTLTVTGTLTINALNTLSGAGNITTILQGNLTCNGSFKFDYGTVSLEMPSGTQALQLASTANYFNSLKINCGETVTINNTLSVMDNLTIQSGIFNPQNNTINVTGDWINTAGPDHFIEGTGKVVFIVIINKGGNRGVYDNLCNNTETFNILEVNNPYGYFVVNNASAVVTCNQYDYTAGGVNVLAGTFTATDLADDAIYGYFGLQTGGIINLTNSDSYVDLSGYLNITGGTFNVYGGTDQSYWPYNNNAGITMSSGTLNFADQGIRVHGSLTLTSNITGGTIKTSQGFANYRSDFNPTGGTIELVGSTDATLYCLSTASFYSLNINKVSGIANLTSTLTLNGNFTLSAGTFNTNNYTIQAKRNWTNSVGQSAFNEGTGRVIFNGGNYIQYCSSEVFNILELNKASGSSLTINGGPVSCNEYDWTAGAVAASGSFTATILNDNCVAGDFYVYTGGVINLGNGIGNTDLKGNLYVYGGTLNIFSGSASQWPGSGNASITMNSGQLNVYPYGIIVLENPPYTFTTNISGGTIKTPGNIEIHRSDFVQTGGTLEMYGSTDATLSMYTGSLWGVTINKTTSYTAILGLSATVNGPLTVQSGVMKATDKILSTGGDININSGGTLWIENGSQLKITGNKVLTINVAGTLKALGTSVSKPVITRNGSTPAHQIEVYGTISARYAIFEHNYGVNIWSSGTIDPANPFDQCTFQNGIDRFLLISNSQVLTIRGANFPTAPLYNNVWKNNDAGRITFRDATGAYAGATYENDLYNRIDWVVTQPGLWTGAVSSNWNTPENWDDLTVPVSSTNVTIPAGLYMMPIISSGTAYCNNLTVAGTMTIRSAILQVGGNMAIGGTLGMNNASGQLIVQGDVDWNSGSAAAFTENSVFHVYGHWNFNAGANAQLANGSVFFKGSSAKFIRSYSANCSFWNLVTNKTGMYSTEFSDVSTQPLTVNGSLTTEINSKFIVSSNQTLTIKGNIIGNGVFQCNAGRVKLNGASQTITPNGSDYFNNLDFNQSGTVSILNTYSNILYIRGGLTILSGIFDAGGNTINIRGGWSNTPGSAAFVEGSSQVIFNGTLGQAIYTNEDFNILEINKPSGEIFINGTSVTCNSYNWTAGLIKLANSGVFTANDLADNGVFGQYDLQSGAVVNLHQDIYQYVDINGSLHIEDGSAINIYGGNGWSQWATGANTTLFMSGGVLDFKDQGININTMSPYSLTTDITGGTIRTTGGFFCNRSDFAPADGTLELYGTNDATLEVYSGSVKNLKINKTLTASPLSNTVNLLSNISIRGLTVESGTLKATNKMITTADDINVNYGGTLWLENAAQLLIMGEKALIVNEGGLLKALGETGSKPVITRNGITSNHEIHIYGTIAARYAIFEYNAGLDVSAIGSVDPSNPLYQCTFQNSTNSALYVNNSQDLIIRNANFPSVLFGNNVTKFFDTGHVTFKDATGAYAGAAYEYDPNNRIDWSASQPGLWTGLVSTDWHNTGNWDDLTVPTASTNVTIPTGTPNMPVIGSSAAYCNNLTIAGMLTIRNRTADVAGNVNITGLLAMEDVSRLNVLGDMNWNAGSTASVSAVTSMYVSGNWTFTAGSNAQLTNGSVEFTGAVSKKIFIYSATSSFNDVHIDKSGGASMTYDFASTGPMRTKGLFVRINSNFISNSLLNNIIVTGNVYSFGIMALNATVIEFTGTDHILLPNVNDYYGGFMFKQSGTVTINQSNTNTVDVRGGIYIYSGIFSPGNSILKIQNRWENNSGSPAFAEGTSRVIFTGTTPLYCSTEQFYIVEIDKSSNYLYVDYNATMTCQIFDWTQGGMWIYNNGSFSAADLADDGIYGSFVMEGNLVELHQDAAQRVDLRGNITISAGQFNVYGGVDNSYWGSGANASLTMTSGVFDMVDQAIIVQDVAPFSFTSAITGGTIRTQRGMLAHTSGFNPDGGLVEIYGNQNAPLGSDNGAAFYNVTINKPDGMTRTSLWSLLVKNNLTVEEGMAELSFGQVLECQGDIDVNQGGWFAVTSGTVKMADLTAINVNNGGDLSSEGYEGAPSVFTIIEPPSSFAFNVNSGGNMTVYHSVFEYMGEQGINIAAGAIVNTWKEFNNCEFRNGQSGAYPLLSINNNQVLVIKDAIFPENTWGGTYNVSKGVSSGHLYFINATGAFAGEGFENDPYDLIDWIDPLSAIATATPQTICAGSSSQLDVIRTGGLAPFTYLWSPAAGLSDPGISNPIASPLASTSYSVTVTDALGQMATSEVFLTVNPPLIVSVTISAWYNPSPPGTMVTFSAYPTNGGITPSYQWKVNGSDVGSDLDTYAYYPLNGDQVTCVLTSSAPCVIGNPATSNIITMAMVPVYTNVSGDILAGTDTCYNASATITVPVAPATFNVYPGGSATFIAGVRVRFLPGARVQPGGYVHAYITTTNEYCGSLPPAMVAVVAGDKETSSLSVEPYQTFSIYPNPTSGAFTLLNRSDFFTGKVEVDIYNLSGGKSLSTTYTNERSHVFTLGELPPGIYFVKVKAGDLMESHKLIVTR